MKKVRIKSIMAGCFRSHRSFAQTFDDLTNIEGRNGEGKSSVGDMVTWCLYGLDMMGSKLDPTPLTYEGEPVVEMVLEVTREDGNLQIIQLTRFVKGGKNSFKVNEVTKKATEFSDVVESIGDQNLMMSLLHPMFFTSQKWEAQREQLLKFVPEPLNKEVLKQLPDNARYALEPELKKRNLDDAETWYREQAAKQEKEHAKHTGAMESVRKRRDDLVIQLQDMEEDRDLEELAAAKDELQKQLEEVKKNDFRMQRYQLSGQIEKMKAEGQQKANAHREAQKHTVDDTCLACGQALTEEQQQKAHEANEQYLSDSLLYMKKLKSRIDDLQAELNKIPDTDPVEVIVDLTEKISDIDARIRTVKALITANEEYDAAIKARNEASTLSVQYKAGVDAVKLFRGKQAEIMSEKLQEMFPNLTIKLYQDFKTSDAVKPTFEVERNGIPFRKLSVGEKIKVGVDIIFTLSGASGMSAPVFIDNAESVTNLFEVCKFRSSQVILAAAMDKPLDFRTHAIKKEGETA